MTSGKNDESVWTNTICFCHITDIYEFIYLIVQESSPTTAYIFSHSKPQKPKKKDPHSRTPQIHKHTLCASLSMSKVNRLPVLFIGLHVCETMLCFPDTSCGAMAQQVEAGGKRECREEKKR